MRVWLAAAGVAGAVVFGGGAFGPPDQVAQAKPQPLTMIAPLVSNEYAATMARADRRGHEVWDAVAMCESHGRWSQHLPHHRYSGGLEFAQSTWVAAGGRVYAEHPYEATREEQITVADSWLARTSWRQWPACSRKLGLR